MSFLKSIGVLILVLFAFSIGCGGKGKKETDAVNQGGDETTKSGGGPVTDATGPEVVGSTPGGTAVPVPGGTDSISGGATGAGAGTPTGGGTTGGTGTGTAPAPTGTTGGTSGGTRQTPIGTWSPTLATVDLTQISGITTSPSGSGQTSPTFVNLTPTYEVVNIASLLPPPPMDLTMTRSFQQIWPAFVLAPDPLIGIHPKADESWAAFRKREANPATGTSCENYIEVFVTLEYPNDASYFNWTVTRDAFGQRIWLSPKREWVDLELLSYDSQRQTYQREILPLPREAYLPCSTTDPVCKMTFHAVRTFNCPNEDVASHPRYAISVEANQNAETIYLADQNNRASAFLCIWNHESAMDSAQWNAWQQQGGFRDEMCPESHPWCDAGVCSAVDGGNYLDVETPASLRP